jgi:hypothetical protein
MCLRNSGTNSAYFLSTNCLHMRGWCMCTLCLCFLSLSPTGHYTGQSTTGVNCLVPKSYHIFKLMFFSFFRKLKIKINGRKEGRNDRSSSVLLKRSPLCSNLFFFFLKKKKLKIIIPIQSKEKLVSQKQFMCSCQSRVMISSKLMA